MLYIERTSKNNIPYEDMPSYVHDERGGYEDAIAVDVKQIPVDRKKVVAIMNRFGISAATNITDVDLKNLVSDNSRKNPEFKKAIDDFVSGKKSQNSGGRMKELVNADGQLTKEKTFFTTQNVVIGLAIIGLGYWAWKSGMFKSK